MKFRLGAKTGTPVAKEGAETAGVYFALSDAADGVVGLQGIYYGRTLIWPEVGAKRITALRLQVSAEDSARINRYANVSGGFLNEGSYFRARIGTRLFQRNSTRAQIIWNSNANTLFFLKNSGPWAGSVKRGDSVALEFEAAQELQIVAPEQRLTDWKTVTALITPAESCNVFMVGYWRDSNGNVSHAYNANGGTALYTADGRLVEKAEAWRDKKKKWYGKITYTYISQERQVKDITYPFYLKMRGTEHSCGAIIIPRRARGALSCRVLEVIEQA